MARKNWITLQQIAFMNVFIDDKNTFYNYSTADIMISVCSNYAKVGNGKVKSTWPNG